MTSFRSALGVALISSAAFGHAALPVRAGDNLATAAVMSPLKARTFDMGTKRVIAFYDAEKATCKVTVLVAEQLKDAGEIPSSSVRFDANVAAGTSARTSTATGSDLNLVCGADAASLKIEALNRVSYVLPARN